MTHDKNGEQWRLCTYRAKRIKDFEALKVLKHTKRRSIFQRGSCDAVFPWMLKLQQHTQLAYVSQKNCPTQNKLTAYLATTKVWKWSFGQSHTFWVIKLFCCREEEVIGWQLYWRNAGSGFWRNNEGIVFEFWIHTFKQWMWWGSIWLLLWLHHGVFQTQTLEKFSAIQVVEDS